MSNRQEQLRKFLDAMIDDNSEQAQVHFHGYLEDRMKNIVNPQEDRELDTETDDE